MKKQEPREKTGKKELASSIDSDERVVLLYPL